MRRLFFRIWGLTVAAVLLALTVEIVVLLVGDPEADEATVATRMAGGALLARDAVRASTDRAATLAELTARFGYPVRVVDQLPVAAGEGVFAWYGDAFEPTVATALAPGRWIQLGPLPAAHLSSLTETLTRAGLVLLGVAALLFVILKRVQRRLTQLEAAARHMSDGALDTRVAVEPGTETETIATVFNRMAAQVEAAVAAREQLLRAVSHDLRTPLTRAQLGLHLLGASDGDDLLDQIAAIEGDLEAMNGLIQQLLNTARFATPDRRPTVIGPALAAMIARREGLAALAITRSPRSDCGAWPVDPQAFERAIGNLIDNALRFAQSRIEIDAWIEGEALHVTVTDDGPGVPASERERVFEPFARAVQDAAGVGLGLSLVKAATEAHGGAAGIGDAPGGGCRVWTRWGA